MAAPPRLFFRQGAIGIRHLLALRAVQSRTALIPRQSKFPGQRCSLLTSQQHGLLNACLLYHPQG